MKGYLTTKSPPTLSALLDRAGRLERSRHRTTTGPGWRFQSAAQCGRISIACIRKKRRDIRASYRDAGDHRLPPAGHARRHRRSGVTVSTPVIRTLEDRDGSRIGHRGARPALFATTKLPTTSDCVADELPVLEDGTVAPEFSCSSPRRRATSPYGQIRAGRQRSGCSRR
jgi:hypothetical protein